METLEGTLEARLSLLGSSAVAVAGAAAVLGMSCLTSELQVLSSTSPADLNAAVGQLPYNTRRCEAQIVAGVLQERAQRRRGASAIGDLLPAVLARLNVTEENQCGDWS